MSNRPIDTPRPTGVTKRSKNTGPDCTHTLFSYCHNCETMGPYYFGDMTAEKGNLKGKDRRRRMVILETVLEGLEEFCMDGDWFATIPFARAIGMWSPTVYPPLRWLEHLGMLDRAKFRGHGNTNFWRVVKNPNG